MRSTAARFIHRLALWPLPVAGAVAITLAWAPAGHAADAHRAVQAKPGDIVLLRNVSTRPAYRPAPPGMALMASPSPRSEVDTSLDAHELTDEDFAQLDAASLPATHLRVNALGRSLDAMLVRGAKNETTIAGMGHPVGAPMGAVGHATGGIGEQVQGALSQLPIGNGH